MVEVEALAVVGAAVAEVELRGAATGPSLSLLLLLFSLVVVWRGPSLVAVGREVGVVREVERGGYGETVPVCGSPEEEEEAERVERLRSLSRRCIRS